MAARKAVKVIWNEADRATVLGWCKSAELGTLVEFRAPRRTTPQNDRMWAMLTDIVKQKKEVNGRTHSTNEWKAMFMEMLGYEQELMASLDGKRFFSMGTESSKLGKAEMSELIESIFAWGAENDVKWSDPTLESYIAMMRS
jgi:hypothetical protein